jgi:hypothetical protein
MTKPDLRCALENPSLHFLCPDPSVRERRGAVRQSDRGGGAHGSVRRRACPPDGERATVESVRGGALGRIFRAVTTGEVHGRAAAARSVPGADIHD